MTDIAFLTVQEVAKLLKLNIITIYAYIRSQHLKAVKFGRTYRIEKQELFEFIRKHRIN